MVTATSSYLNRRLRSLPEFLAQLREPHARLAEVHAAIDRTEMELRQISDLHPLDSDITEYADAAIDMLKEWRADYLRPVDEEMSNAARALLKAIEKE